MDINITEQKQLASGVMNIENTNKCESAEDFQKFISILFENNGVLNDLRAYLRSHIIEILKNAINGNAPGCQKLFTQRLDLPSQAFNILIAEYLLRFEFNYTLSVFLSELPLANMVFKFAKSLMKIEKDSDFSLFRIKESDIVSILNYLGVKIDSKHARNIITTYNDQEDVPLLVCIFKCLPFYKKDVFIEQVNSSDESLLSERLSDALSEAQKSTSYCKHYVKCISCRNRDMHQKEKYKRKKKHIEKNITKPIIETHNVDNLMRNIAVLEKNLIDEMFNQMKTVYETEIDMVKEEEENKVKRSLANHSLLLQQKMEEMESSYKSREAELENNIRKKKQFLWQLAKALREQHGTMMQAMDQARDEAKRLADKEVSLKSQLLEAEDTLTKRSEEMRSQIAKELKILEDHLENMKLERDSIDRDRSQLDQRKSSEDKDKTLQKTETSEMKTHYDLIKNELVILKKYIQNAKLDPKNFTEKETLTDGNDITNSKVNVLNNEQGVYLMCEEDRSSKAPNQVVNDLKKMKNVNFNQSPQETFQDVTLSSASSESGDGQIIVGSHNEELVRQLTEENYRLKTLARQQREQISALTSSSDRLRTQLFATTMPQSLRPRTAPQFGANGGALLVGGQIVNPSTSLRSRQGAGEELSLFHSEGPSGNEPFRFTNNSRHGDDRRHLINQWRTLRRRVSPLGGVTKFKTNPQIVRDRNLRFVNTTNVAPAEFSSLRQHFRERMYDEQRHDPVEALPDVSDNLNTNLTARPNPTAARSYKNREKSPKTVLKEAKEKLRTKESFKTTMPPSKRDTSPNAVLKEAKQRLRKLEMEAEAVERSYRDFRRQQDGRSHQEKIPDIDYKSFDLMRNRSLQRYNEKYVKDIPPPHYKNDEKLNQKEFDKYFKNYQNKLDIQKTHFRNKNAISEMVKPIPESYADIDNVEATTSKVDDLLDTPLIEFRKFYTKNSDTTNVTKSNKHKNDTRKGDTKYLEDTKSVTSDNENALTEQEYATKKEDASECKSREDLSNKKNVLSNNISENKVKNFDVEMTKDKENFNIATNINRETKHDSIVQSKNILRIEIENVTKTSSLQLNQNENDVSLVVHSSADVPKEKNLLSVEENGDKRNTTVSVVVVSPKKYLNHKENLELDNEKSPNAISHTPEKSIIPNMTDIFKEETNLKQSSIDSEKIIPSTNMTDIFNAESNLKQSSIDINIGSKRDNIDLEDEIIDDYLDDFSADVDNYNSMSDIENLQSPISMAKSSESDNFWGSSKM